MTVNGVFFVGAAVVALLCYVVGYFVGREDERDVGGRR